MSAVKALQQWCRIQCEGYRDVSITNMTTSFRDGLAFCALIHKHRPDLINFDSLKKEDVYDNNKLAFKVAEEQLGIPALLDAEDMVALRVPDRLSILTYVSQYYNYFHGRSPIGGMAGIKRPAEGTNDEPSGKKNQAVTAMVFPGSKPSRENSPPRSANVTKPSPSPKQIRNSTQERHVEKSQAGTLSNKCVLCNKHVHLVQRQLVEGKLYHRNCARSLSTNTSSLFRDLPTNTHISKFSPQPEPVKPATVAPAKTPSRLGPTWATEKPGSPPNGSSSFSASPVSAPASVVKETPKVPVSKPSTFTTGVSTNPTAAPRTSVTAAKTFESKMKFLQSDDSANHEEKKTSVFRTTVNKGQTTNGKGQDVLPGQTVTMVVNVKDVDKGGAAKTTAAGSKASTNAKEYDDKTRATAAAFISKKLPEENNNNNSSKPSWTNVALRKTDKPLEETPKKTETGGVRGKVKLKADLSLLADLQTPEPDKSSAGRCGGADKTPDRGGLKPPQTSHNTSASEKESPGAWRSKLKPISKEAKPAGLPQSSPKPYSNGATRTSEPSAGPPAVSAIISVSKESQNGPKEQIPNAAKSESKNAKTKPGYIPKEDMIRELKEIEENLNELERRGVELELRLRKSEEEGSDDDEDELMVEWFTLIRNKQVAMRRESELVYIGRTQDLEEEQPSVEQELRRLMDKPEHLKTFRDRQREKQLMDKLIEIVNDRNAIIEGLDEDRLREEEEDEELNKMMMNFNIKKDKIKRKSQKFRLFSWGSKKDA
ncbi:protein-methionine sulfoxide oxidase mical2b [Poecilia reticulata]|uniref:protein-methionine sulfoxide oxidase mical2b n=1 Tax=Poecilia reticulata TaxID=8081 RepID=UPI0004A31C4F|nr:PREDICTED: MICAL-like protein 1 [Poecilia reticulata]